MICGHCSREQNYRPEDCGVCHSSLIKKAGSGFWEGGKGTRDKSRMSRKGKQKTSSFTVSWVWEKRRTLYANCGDEQIRGNISGDLVVRRGKLKPLKFGGGVTGFVTGWVLMIMMHRS